MLTENVVFPPVVTTGFSEKAQLPPDGHPVDVIFVIALKPSDSVKLKPAELSVVQTSISCGDADILYPQLGTVKEPIRVLQLPELVLARYSDVNQKVHPSSGSISIAE